ncbi:MAG: peptidylprolyl isomerase [candidate division WOR-3 bacterium]
MIMQKMRKLAGVVLWILILAFIGWIGLELGANIVGYKVYQPWERGIVAKVGNYEISYNEFYNEFQKVISDTTRKLKRELTNEEIETLRKKVFDEVVENIRWKLLLEDLKISLTPDAIVRIITLFPPSEILEDTIFYTDGKFDYGKYISLLRDQRSIPFFKDYENRLRRDIPKDIVRYYISVLSNPSDEDAKYEYLYRNRRIKIFYASIPANVIPDTLVRISEDELRKYYRDNKEEFRAPERVKLLIIRAFKYPSVDDSLLARERIENIKEQAKVGENFNKLAFLFSEDITTKNDSGRVKNFLINNLYSEVRDSFLNSKEGDIIGPILTPIGYQIFKIDKKNKDTVDYSQILIKINPSVQTKKLILDSLKNAIKNKDFRGFRVDTSDYIPTKFEFLPVVGQNDEVRNFIKKGKVGQFSRIFDMGNILVAFGIIDKKKEGYEDYDRVKSIIESRLIVQKKKNLLREKIESVINFVKNNDSLGIKLMFNNDPRVVVFESGLITSDMYFPGLPFGQREKFFNEAFSKNLNEVSVFEHDQGFLIYKKLEDFMPDMKNFEFQKFIIKSQLYQKNFQNLLSDFEREIRERYPLEDYSEYFEIK